MSTRSLDDIAARLRQVHEGGTDFMGWRAEVLAEFLDLQRLRSLELLPLEPDKWNPRLLGDAPRVGAEYLVFAFSKALGHRGISASRSVEKLTEYAWLQGRDDVVTAMDQAPYAQYGMPALLVYAQAFGRPVPHDERVARMGRGEACDPKGCTAGCGT